MVPIWPDLLVLESATEDDWEMWELLESMEDDTSF
jgi:hypothetical protein